MKSTAPHSHPSREASIVVDPWASLEPEDDGDQREERGFERTSASGRVAGTLRRAGASLLAARKARKARAFADDGSGAGRYAHRFRHVRSYQPAPGEREGVSVTSNFTTVGGLARPILAGLPGATRAMNAESSTSRGDRGCALRVISLIASTKTPRRRTGCHPGLVPRDAVEGLRIVGGSDPARPIPPSHRPAGTRVDASRDAHLRASSTSSRRVDIRPDRLAPKSDARWRCVRRGAPRASSRRTKTCRATSAITCAFSRSTLRRASLQSNLRDGAEERGEARVPSRDAFDGIRQRQIPRIRRG